MKILPHQSTIRRWLSSSNCRPGISVDALTQISEMCKEASARGETFMFSLVTDEMAIMKNVEFDGKELVGFVDVGERNDLDYRNNTEAKNALVFMLVGINIYVKVAVAYYLIDSLTGEERSNILSDILHVTHEHGINVCNVTFDGASSNITMVEKLGAKIHDYKNLKTYIKHPVSGEQITVMLDACHMIKLLRNTLHAKKCFSDENDQLIKWSYFEALVRRQEEEGLHLGTKLRDRHINFLNEKMKVCIAAQTLSFSVSAALTACEVDYKFPEFEGAGATAQFCQDANDIFDLLNSRNLLCKSPTKQAIRKETLAETKMKVERFIAKIEAWKLDGIPLLHTKNKTGFLGLIVCLKSVILLAERLFTETSMTFLLTYKLSQDHLETFFGYIRRMSGCNNNPTVRQFISAMKKLHSHVATNITFNGNCIPRDETEILKINCETPPKESDIQLDDIIWDAEHDYAVSPIMSLSEYQEDVLAYIAGFMVKQTAKELHCPICIQSLKQDKTTSHLQIRKTFGKLTNASDDVIRLAIAAETKFRENDNTTFLTSKNVVERLILLTLRSAGIDDLFTNLEHALDQAPLMDHRHQLIRMLLTKFFKSRLRHWAAGRNSVIRRIRSKLTRLAIFHHQ